MRWREVDKALREGAELHDSHVGAWIVLKTADGERSVNIRHNVLRAVLVRDLVVIQRKHSASHYSYRSKYRRGDYGNNA